MYRVWSYLKKKKLKPYVIKTTFMNIEKGVEEFTSGCEHGLGVLFYSSLHTFTSYK